MKGIIYTCIPVKCIPQGLRRDEGVEYCGGWDDFSNMGISCIAAYELHNFSYRIFLEDNLHHFGELVKECNLIIGFNSLAFADNLCLANGLDVHTNYDLLVEIRVASGQPPVYTPGVTRKGYDLETLVYTNFNERLSIARDLIPKRWQEGSKGKVIDFALNDVRWMKLLWDNREQLLDPTNGNYLQLQEPKTLHMGGGVISIKRLVTANPPYY